MRPFEAYGPCLPGTAIAGVAGEGKARGPVAVAPQGDAEGCHQRTPSAEPCAEGLLAASALGPARSCPQFGVSGWRSWAAASVLGDASGFVAVSGTGHAEGAVALSGCDALGLCVEPPPSLRPVVAPGSGTVVR